MNVKLPDLALQRNDVAFLLLYFLRRHRHPAMLHAEAIRRTDEQLSSSDNQKTERWQRYLIAAERIRQASNEPIEGTPGIRGDIIGDGSKA